MQGRYACPKCGERSLGVVERNTDGLWGRRCRKVECGAFTVGGGYTSAERVLLPAVHWRVTAQTFLAELEREERELALDIRRATERRQIEEARSLAALQSRVGVMKRDTRALLEAMSAVSVPPPKGYRDK